MCGIAGIFSYASSAGVDRAQLARMGDLLAHRGPDDEGLVVSDDRRIGLAHRRLAIVDPDSGQQPFVGPRRTLLVFNGEIYNYPELRLRLERAGHALRTRCDTEAVSLLYEDHGPDMVDLIDGMFAFAVWDPAERRLFMARDRLGEKPLYWNARAGVLTFASEIKALFADPRLSAEVNEAAIPGYFADLVTAAPRTLFRGIFKLAAGSAAICDAEGLRTYRYWTPMSDRRWSAQRRPEAAAHVRELLSRSVHERLLGDVPMGVLLSGGLDSSTLLALLADRVSELTSFSVGFSEHPELDERAEARAVAEHFGIQHHEITVSERDAIAFLPELIHHQDEPLGDPVCIPLHFVCKLARSHGVKVVLAGEGADELFWGYPDYWIGLRRLHQLAPLLSMPAPARRLAASALRLDPRPHMSQLAPGLAAGRLPPMHSSVGMAARHRRALLREHDNAAADPAWTLSPDAHNRGVDLLAFDTQEFELSVRLPELLLMRIDRFSMANGVEARVPFLSKDLVEYVQRLPLDLKLANGTSKIVLRDAVADVVPSRVLQRPKQGFGAPTTAWLSSTMGGLLGTLLDGEGARCYFRVERLKTLVAQDRAGKQRWPPRVWPIMNFLLWHRHWIEGRPLEELVEPLLGRPGDSIGEAKATR
jgi:asparagine synthase (glutamine-hydrolysing)